MCRKRFAEPKIFTTFVVRTTEQGRNIAPIIRRVEKFEGLFCCKNLGLFFIDIDLTEERKSDYELPL